MFRLWQTNATGTRYLPYRYGYLPWSIRARKEVDPFYLNVKQKRRESWDGVGTGTVKRRKKRRSELVAFSKQQAVYCQSVFGFYFAVRSCSSWLVRFFPVPRWPLTALTFLMYLSISPRCARSCNLFTQNQFWYSFCQWFNRNGFSMQRLFMVKAKWYW